MDSVQGLMNISMVNNLEETGAAPEERSTWDNVKNVIDVGGVIIRFITWVCGAAAPAPLRTASRIASGVDYAEKAYDILQRNASRNRENAIPFQDGGMSTREYLDYTPTNQQYLDYNSSFDIGSVFKKEF